MAVDESIVAARPAVRSSAVGERDDVTAATNSKPATASWSALPLRERVSRVCALRHVLAQDPQPFIDAIQTPFRRSPVETLAAEITPLADACRFLERRAKRILRPRHLGFWGRPLWVGGVTAQIRREPLGTVLVIGPANYPLMLPGIQVIQALVAGNDVVLKPAPGNSHIALVFADALHRLGVPADALQVIDESPEAVRPWLGRVDKVVLTGSERTGRRVMHDLADHLVPSTMELSGCDAVFVLPDADLDLVTQCIRFGLSFNSSATCIAPRRIFVDQAIADDLASRLAAAVADAPASFIGAPALALLNELGADAIAGGAVLIAGRLPAAASSTPIVFDHVRHTMRLVNEDVMAPVTSLIRVRTIDEAIAANRTCQFRLGASVFGSAAAAGEIAARIPAGSVVVNDLIAPTSDPRLPFGGGGRSGFGVTRGAEGLLEMTRIKTISTRRRGLRFHLTAEDPHTSELLRAGLTLTHAKGIRPRLRGLIDLISAARKQSRRQEMKLE